MRAQEKNNKGFNLIEVVTVLSIIGILSIAALPKFSAWQNERKAHDQIIRRTC